MSEQRFGVWIPFTKSLCKADKDGEWWIGGIITSEREDLDGEIVDYGGVGEALKSFVSTGAHIDYDHQHKLRSNPKYLVGKMMSFESITLDNGVRGYAIKGKLFKSKEIAQEIWRHLEDGGYLGWSLGGKVLRRVGNSLRKIFIDHIAITPSPINTDTSVIHWKEFVKSLGKCCGACDKPGTEYQCSELKKAIDTEVGKPLMRESLEGDVKVVTLSDRVEKLLTQKYQCEHADKDGKLIREQLYDHLLKCEKLTDKEAQEVMTHYYLTVRKGGTSMSTTKSVEEIQGAVEEAIKRLDEKLKEITTVLNKAQKEDNDEDNENNEEEKENEENEEEEENEDKKIKIASNPCPAKRTKKSTAKPEDYDVMSKAYTEEEKEQALEVSPLLRSVNDVIKSFCVKLDGSLTEQAEFNKSIAETLVAIGESVKTLKEKVEDIGLQAQPRKSKLTIMKKSFVGSDDESNKLTERQIEERLLKAQRENKVSIDDVVNYVNFRKLSETAYDTIRTM